MILYIALALFAFIPFGAYILHQKTQNKGLVLGISFIYLLLSLFIFLLNCKEDSRLLQLNAPKKCKKLCFKNDFLF